MHIIHVNASDLEGGAARAAFRIHRSLVENGKDHGIHSLMRVIKRSSDDSTVIGGAVPQNRLWKHLHPFISWYARRRFRSGNPVLHSFAWPGTGLGGEMAQRYQQGTLDLLHLHWIGFSTLSIEEIGRLPMPLVWTLHDQWPFCGGEHYTSPPQSGDFHSSDERFTLGYSPASRPVHESGPDLNRRTWLRKRRAWHRPIHIVATTNWLAECAGRSTLMANWPIRIIPYPIDLNFWAPVEQEQARYLLGLPPDCTLVLFGADGGTADPRKGADLLFTALQILRPQVSGSPLQGLELVVFGQNRPVTPQDLGFPIHYMGRVNEDLILRLMYAAADVMVVPSRQEAFGQTASEAHACGTPVVAFRTGGLVDIVDDRITGALANPFDPLSLAEAIRWVVEDLPRKRELGAAARQRALRLWDPARVAGLYADVYNEVLMHHILSSK